MDLYAENILEHFRNPQHKVALVSPDVTHEEINVSCGDKVTVMLKIANGAITEIGWQGEGCAISQAGMSLLSEGLPGMSLEEVVTLARSDIDALLGVPVGARRFKCALLCIHAVKNACRIYQKLPPQSWLDTVGVA